MELPSADRVSYLCISQTGPSRRRAPEPPPRAEAAGAVGTSQLLALPRGLLTQVLDSLQASRSCPLPPGEEHEWRPGRVIPGRGNSAAKVRWGLPCSLRLLVASVQNKGSPATPLLGICPKELKTRTQTNSYNRCS